MVQWKSKTNFSITRDVPKQPSLTKNGKEIWDMIFERDRNKGAYFTEILGLMGSGKTSLMFGMADKSLRENPKEINFLREPQSAPCQFPKLESDFQILCEDRCKLKLYEIREGEPPIESDAFKIRRFCGIGKLIKMSKPGIMNVVYFQPKKLYKWYYLIDRLKLDGSWQQIWMDEAEDVFPLNATGKFYEANTLFSNSAKQIRKGRVGLTYNTQNSHDCDWRIRYKIMVWFYLRGSRVDPLSPIFSGAIRNLEVGQSYVDFLRGQFGVIRFKPYIPKEVEYVILGGEDMKLYV